MSANFLEHTENTLKQIKSDGLYKIERAINSPQSGQISVQANELKTKPVLNLCANNYLGLANHPDLIEAAKKALDTHGYGMASVRFICGTQDIHRKLEIEIADYLGKDDAILYAACFDANGGLFEPLLTAEDAIISDSLNHASIIDGVRLCKAQRYRFENSNMEQLEAKLKEARSKGARFVMILTDGVFSMDGTLANLTEITGLAKQYDAIVMVDDCHATGFIGPNGRGTHFHFGIENDVHILTGTLGKALGGAMGGYVAGPQAVIDLLRQRSRPYLFSNSLAPSIVAAGLKALEIVKNNDDLIVRLFENTKFWRQGLESLGFSLLPGSHPIVPIMLGDARLAQDLASELYEQGVHVAGFFFPVVPKGMARIRTQMNAALTINDLEKALNAFEIAGKKLGVI